MARSKKITSYDDKGKKIGVLRGGPDPDPYGFGYYWSWTDDAHSLHQYKKCLYRKPKIEYYPQQYLISIQN